MSDLQFPILLKKTSQIINSWSGGTTTQLYIYPHHTLYENRNFIVRISTATVEIEMSSFTSLPGYHRSLMLLEGELEINHVDQYTTHLKPFDIVEFEGEWETVGRGIATDFNVMTSREAKHQLKLIQLSSFESHEIIFESNVKYVGFYILSNQLDMKTSAHKYQLEKQDFILFETTQCDRIELYSSEYIHLIQVSISTFTSF